MPNRQKISFAIAAIGLCVLIALMVFELNRRQAPPNGLTAAIGGPFSLTDHTGAPKTAADFAGRPLLIFFGFTYCPDVCPTALDRVGAALDILATQNPPAYDALQPLFISVDPTRDTPQALNEYLAYFHPKIIGLTGTQAEIDAVKRAYKVYAAQAATPDENGNYMVDHSSFFYLMDGDNKYMAHFDHAMTAEDMAAQLIAILR